MNAIGMCPHNNLSGYCPSCLKEKNMGMGRMGNFGGMGACPAGYSDDNFLKVCLPGLEAIGNTLEQAGAGLIASGVAQTPSVQQAGVAAATQGTVTKIVTTIKKHPYITAAVGLVLAAAVANMLFGVSIGGIGSRRSEA